MAADPPPAPAPAPATPRVQCSYTKDKVLGLPNAEEGDTDHLPIRVHVVCFDKHNSFKIDLRYDAYYLSLTPNHIITALRRNDKLRNLLDDTWTVNIGTPGRLVASERNDETFREIYPRMRL